MLFRAQSHLIPLMAEMEQPFKSDSDVISWSRPSLCKQTWSEIFKIQRRWVLLCYYGNPHSVTMPFAIHLIDMKHFLKKEQRLIICSQHHAINHDIEWRRSTLQNEFYVHCSSQLFQLSLGVRLWKSSIWRLWHTQRAEGEGCTGTGSQTVGQIKHHVWHQQGLKLGSQTFPWAFLRQFLIK